MTSEELIRAFVRIWEELQQLYDVQLSISQDKVSNGSDVVAVVTPSNIGAAKIDARLDVDFGVYALFGECANLEVPLNGGYYTGLPSLTETSALCDAVASGRLREEITYAGGKPLKGSFAFVLPDGKSFSESWRNLYVFPLRPREQRTITWEPYVRRRD
jgi:hypothetical protein